MTPDIHSHHIRSKLSADTRSLISDPQSLLNTGIWDQLSFQGLDQDLLPIKERIECLNLAE